MLHLSSIKPVLVASLVSVAFSSNLFAETAPVVSATPATQTNTSSKTTATNAELANEQLAIEQKAMDSQLALEQQQQSEQRLNDVIGLQPLQFKSTIAKIYDQVDYGLLWTDKQAEKTFLRHYAAWVMSAVSQKSATILHDIAKHAETGGVVYDILLTDAFLDYLSYSKNITKYAQKWLYAANKYKSVLPLEQDIEGWLYAVKNNQHLQFIEDLSTANPFYQQTIDALLPLIAESKLDKKAVNKLYTLAINAQRLRVIPDFSNGIFVNIPSYELNYFRDGQLVMNSKVIVGSNARKTPVMFSKLSNVVVNPPWLPTTKLINEDIVPRIKKDPSYAERNGYTILDADGSSVDPYMIDWEDMGHKFPYRIRQAPGDSALGNYKFNMPSTDAIYLHDTPKRNLFAKKNRALSSGCIRVEKSEQLATILLFEAGWTEERKQRVLKSRRTTSENILSDNPVYLYYVTAWMENGVMKTLPDIYKYDKLPNLNYINLDLVEKYLQ